MKLPIFRISITCLIWIFLIQTFLSNEINGQASVSSGEEKRAVLENNPLYMLTYDHGGLVLWGTDHFAKYLHSATNWLDKYPGFKIGLDNEAYTYDWLNKNDQGLLNEIRGFLDKYNGRFGIGTCTYGQPLSQFINEESNIRQIGYALETDKSIFHYTPPVYLMSEHAMHSQIPQILNGFGFKGAIMRTHFMMYGYNPTFNSPIGWWVGRDGSKIPAIPTYKGEGNRFGWVTEDNMILTRYPGPECREPLEEFRKKFSHINPLLATRADDSGLRQEGLVKEYEGRPGYKWLLLDEIFPLFPSPKDVYMTMPDDFHVRMPWGYCGNEIWNMSRTAEIKVLTAERLSAMDLLLGGGNNEKKLTDAWKNLLVAQHHDIQICGILEDSRRFLPASINISDSLIEASMNFISLQMLGGTFGQITVFNPLSWSRKELFEIRINLPEGVKEFEIRDGNENIPFDVLSSIRIPGKRLMQWELLVQADVPALAFRSFSIAKPIKPIIQQKIERSIQFDRQEMSITTPFWKIILNNDGGISDLKSQSTGKELLKGTRNCYFAGIINGQPLESTGKWNLDSVKTSCNSIVLSETGNIGTIPYKLEMKLNALSPEIVYSVKFQFNDEKIGRLSENKREVTSAFLHEEKLRFKVYPALGIGTTGIRDLPFTIAETYDKYIEGNYWTCLADGHAGLAIFNRGNMGSVNEDDGSFSIPLAYSMYYIWKTVMLKGSFNYQFSLYPFEGKWEEAGLHRKALEFSFPLITIFSKKGNGKEGNMIKLFDISGSDVILSAFYSVEGNPVLRFYESQGTTGSLKINYLRNGYGFMEILLNGNQKGNAEEKLGFDPWQIRTFRLNLR